ncbi:tegument protein [Suid betaherpesvirus 2]|uniref:Tegument protein n=1 Tax=Suid betaherpesvirus 2 TaxID=1608255 RepID=U3GQ34_9BETA|nr:tegument protein [Suid betaherpesvirus 2]AGT99260.1 tegument protein [Suid betaherpesvirus 2]
MAERKKIISQLLKKQLEEKQSQSLRSRLGEEHPLCASQDVALAKEIVKVNLMANEYLIKSVSDISKECKYVRQQQDALKNLRRMRLDDLLDAVLDVKDGARDIKSEIMGNPLMEETIE